MPADGTARAARRGRKETGTEDSVSCQCKVHRQTALSTHRVQDTAFLEETTGDELWSSKRYRALESRGEHVKQNRNSRNRLDGREVGG